MSLKKDLIDKQVRFWVLMAGGATLTGASETVGVSRATGRKWRQATGGRIPRRRPESSGRYLSLEERLQIADLYLGGAGVRAIAVEVGRSASTVSRELRRNGSAPTARRPGKYAPYAAQTQAELRGRRPKASKSDHGEPAAVGQSRQCVKWSPEHISLHLAETFPELAGDLRSVRTLVPLVHLPVLLAGPGPSGSTDPSRRCRGCLPPSPASPGSGCPQLRHAAATARRRRSFTSTR